jgi:mevalonate kinase
MAILYTRWREIILAPELYKASAPGSLMLMGEHAVLQGKHALVAAINRRIRVTLKPRADRLIYVSSALGTLKTSIDSLRTLEREKSFRFVLAAIDVYHSKLTLGFELTIESEFSDKIGFGSSAAVVVATLKVLDKFINLSPSQPINVNSKEPINLVLFQLAKTVIQQVQGVGSGADVAASIMGGIVFFRTHPLVIEKLALPSLPSLVAVYSGYKMPTEEVIQIVEKKRLHSPQIYDGIFQVMEQCTVAAYHALQKEDWEKLGCLFNIQHGLMSALGVSDTTLDYFANTLRGSTEIKGAKISGSGLGDCVVGLGTIQAANRIKELEAHIVDRMGVLKTESKNATVGTSSADRAKDDSIIHLTLSLEGVL